MWGERGGRYYGERGREVGERGEGGMVKEGWNEGGRGEIGEGDTRESEN